MASDRLIATSAANSRGRDRGRDDAPPRRTARQGSALGTSL